MPQDQLQSDNVLEDVACMLGCTRSSLHGAVLVPGAHSVHIAPVQLQLIPRALAHLKACVSVVIAICAAAALFVQKGNSEEQKCLRLHVRLTDLGPAVVASEKGVVVGRLTFREDGDLINCQRMGVGGKAVPPNVDKVHRLQLAEYQD